MRDKNPHIGFEKMYTKLCSQDGFTIKRMELKTMMGDHKLSQKAICPIWKKDGQCIFGDACKKSHPRKSKKWKRKMRQKKNKNISKENKFVVEKEDESTTTSSVNTKMTKKKKKQQKKKKERKKINAETLALVEGVNKVVDADIAVKQKKRKRRE